MNRPIVLSHRQAAVLDRARQAGQATAEVSLDLGLTSSTVTLQADRILLPGGQSLSWDCVQEIAGSESVCFEIEDNEPYKIQRFSDFLNRFYSLMPTAGAPTLLVSGIPMHRIKDVDPHRDTLNKVRTIAPLVGRVLDTCTGLGYTAIEAARTAEQVITIELDPAVLEVARRNPWSWPLFDGDRIEQRLGDSFDEIESFADGAFARILHDPPTFSLAGDLYSGHFYGQLFRVLARRGRLFHYIGDLDSRSGRNVARGVVRRLQEAGFTRIVRRPEAFGLVATK
jgi:predicted methyltransferase